MRLFEVRHPFFRPLWRRVVVVAICAAWGLVELSGGNTFWVVLFWGIGAICAWEFFVVYDAANYTEAEAEADKAPDTEDDE